MRLRGFLALFLIFMLALAAFGGCAAVSETALTVQDVALDRQIFMYFFDTVRANPEQFALFAASPRKFFAQQAQPLCAEYVAVNTLFAAQGKTLNVQEKAALSARVNDLWRVFGAHYESIGVSKQALMRTQTSAFYRNRLFFDLYDKGGERAVAEKDLQNYFEQNYLVFRVIPGYFTKPDENGTDVPMTDSEKSNLRGKFAQMAQDLREEKSIEEVNDGYVGNSDTVVPLTVLKKGGKAYSEAFYNDVAKLNADTPTVLEYPQENYIFLVVREKADFKSDEQYLSNRESCLKDMKAAEFDAELKAQAEQYHLEPNQAVIDQIISLKK